jgi:hypothetical protein
MQALAEKAMAVSGQRMGRPPLDVQKTTVRLPTGTVDQIKGIVGEHRVAAFIRSAVEEKLAREEKGE